MVVPLVTPVPDIDAPAARLADDTAVTVSVVPEILPVKVSV
jgi:hypothetical protein